MTIKLLSLLIFLPFFYAGAPVHAQTETSPTTTVEQAIEQAKHYADKEEID